jgi:hypothetical protein
MPRSAGDHVERARTDIERKALPFFASRFAETEFAGGPQRETEYTIEMRLVAMPSNADADIVFRAKDLANPGTSAAEGLDLSNDARQQPRRDLDIT